VASGKIQFGVASGGSANVAEPPAEAVLAFALPLEPLPELLPELQALIASTAATPNAARAAGVERDADLNRFLIILQGLDTEPDLPTLFVSPV
jgi:hypothetical protein